MGTVCKHTNWKFGWNWNSWFFSETDIYSTFLVLQISNGIEIHILFCEISFLGEIYSFVSCDRVCIKFLLGWLLKNGQSHFEQPWPKNWHHSRYNWYYVPSKLKCWTEAIVTSFFWNRVFFFNFEAEDLLWSTGQDTWLTNRRSVVRIQCSTNTFELKDLNDQE